MADITVSTAVNSLLHRKAVRLGPVWIDVNTAYVFYEGNSNFQYQKTTDGGATWATAVVITSATAIKISVWYDRWTPGNAGTLIHMAYTESEGDDLFYRNLNTLGDSLSTELKVVDGASYADGAWNSGAVDIVRARGGNLYLAFWGDGDGEFGFYRSTDDGVTWTSRADVADGNEADGILLMPGNETDEDDILCVYWDRSADEISLKTYDNSGDSWSEASVATSMADDVTYYQMSASLRHADNHVILAAWSEIDAATADLKVWDVESGSSITAMTNVLTDTSEATQVAVFINQQDDSIYVVYLKGGTWQATVDAVYKKSIDGGTTWGAEQSYSEAAADDIRALWAGVSVGADGGRFQPAFFNMDLTDLFVNLVNDVLISPVGPFRAAYVGATVDEIPSHGSAVA